MYVTNPGPMLTSQREHDKVDRGMKTANQQLPQVRAELAAKDTVDLGIDYTGLRNVGLSPGIGLTGRKPRGAERATQISWRRFRRN